jgi:hypothetical protein
LEEKGEEGNNQTLLREAQKHQVYFAKLLVFVLKNKRGVLKF